MASDEHTRRRFAWLDQVLRDTDLPPGAFRVAYAVSAYVNRKRGCAWPTQETLAARTGLLPRAVRRLLTQLELHGHLLVDHAKGRGHVNRYALNVLADNVSGETDPDEKASPVSHFGKPAPQEKRTIATYFGKPEAKEKRTKLTIKEDKIDRKRGQCGPPEPFEELFEELFDSRRREIASALPKGAPAFSLPTNEHNPHSPETGEADRKRALEETRRAAAARAHIARARPPAPPRSKPKPPTIWETLAGDEALIATLIEAGSEAEATDILRRDGPDAARAYVAGLR